MESKIKKPSPAPSPAVTGFFSRVMLTEEQGAALDALAASRGTTYNGLVRLLVLQAIEQMPSNVLRAYKALRASAAPPPPKSRARAG